MTYTAKVENDVIRLPSDVHLPNGTVVTIQPKAEPPPVAAPQESFAERYAEFIGIWEDGPTDLAAEHDHYSSGAPKRNE
jgi:hypothetical protein